MIAASSPYDATAFPASLADGRQALARFMRVDLPDDELRRHIFAEQLEATTRALRSALLIVLATVACAVPLFWRTASKPLLFAGIAIVVGTCLWAARKLPARVKPERVDRAARRHISVALSFGVGWALFTGGLGAGAENHAMMMVGCLQVAFICVGLALYLNLPPAFLCFAAPISIPLVIDLCAVPGGWAIAAVVLPMFLTILFRTAVIQCRMFIDAGWTAEQLRVSEAEAHQAQQAQAHAQARAEVHDAETRASAAGIEEERRRTGIMLIAERFEANIGTVVASVSKAVAELAEAAEQLSNLVEATAQTAGDVAGRASSTSQSIGVLSKSAQCMVDALGSVSDRAAAHAARSSAALRLVDGSIGRVVGMGADAATVRGIVDIVDEVTGQTQLLALNAQIEAARAGEAGRGFAVVAGEVKSLALRTAGATSQISVQVHDIEIHVEEAIRSIRSTAAEIDAVASIASSIEASMLEQRGVAEGIGRESASVGADADDVRDRMVWLASEAVSAAALTSQVSRTALSVAGEVASLRAATERFLVGLRAA